jgi:hypothetical protein
MGRRVMELFISNITMYQGEWDLLRLWQRPQEGSDYMSSEQSTRCHRIFYDSPTWLFVLYSFKQHLRTANRKLSQIQKFIYSVFKK